MAVKIPVHDSWEVVEKRVTKQGNVVIVEQDATGKKRTTVKKAGLTLKQQNLRSAFAKNLIEARQFLIQAAERAGWKGNKDIIRNRTKKLRSGVEKLKRTIK